MNEVITTAPNIIPVLTDSANLWVNIALAIVTLGALLVALFQEKIKARFNRTRLDMEINLTPPDCHQIDLNDPRGAFICKSLYVRIKISHKNGIAGENIEIMPVSFSAVSRDGEVNKLDYFLPINLAWSHFQPRTSVMRVPVGLFRHCDFGHFVKRSDGSPLLILDTMIQPNKVAGGEIPNVIKPGKYVFELLLSGDNVKPFIKKWELEFNQWSEDEAQMLKNIKIQAV